MVTYSAYKVGYASGYTKLGQKVTASASATSTSTLSQGDANVLAQEKANAEALKSALNQAETLNNPSNIYYASANATGYAFTSSGVKVSSTATGSATSTLSQLDADAIANANAQSAANQQARNDVDLINESVSEAVLQAVPEAVLQAVVEINYKAVIANSDYTLPTPINSSEVIEVLNSNYPSTGLATTMDGTVNAYAVYGDYVFMGGTFTTVNGIVQNHIAAYDTVNKVLVNTQLFTTTLGVNYGLTGLCTSLELDTNNNVLYIGGDFTSYNNNPISKYIVVSLYVGGNLGNWKWNPVILAQTVPPTITPIGAICNSLLIDNTNKLLYVAGNFISQYILNNPINTTAIVMNTVAAAGTTFNVTIPNNNIVPGQIILGNGFVSNTYVVSVATAAGVMTVTFSPATTAGIIIGTTANFYDPITSQTGANTGAPTAGSTITLTAANALIAVGQYVVGTNIVPGTKVLSINGTALVLDTATVTAVAANTALYFYNSYMDYNLNTINTSTSLGCWNHVGLANNTSSTYNSLALDNTNGILYIGGIFASVQGANSQANIPDQRSIAALSTINVSSTFTQYQFYNVSNFTVPSGLSPILTTTNVNALALDIVNKLLYLGGNMTGAGYNQSTNTYNVVNGLAVADVSKITLTTHIVNWVTPTNLANTAIIPSASLTGHPINTLLLNSSNDTLWIGSSHYLSLYINGVYNTGLVIYDINNDSYLLNDLSLNSSSDVNTIFLNNNNIYVGGAITSYNSISVGNSFYIDDTQTVLVYNNNGVSKLAYLLNNGTAFVFYYNNGKWYTKYGRG